MAHSMLNSMVVASQNNFINLRLNFLILYLSWNLLICCGVLFFVLRVVSVCLLLVPPHTFFLLGLYMVGIQLEKIPSPHLVRNALKTSVVL